MLVSFKFREGEQTNAQLRFQPMSIGAETVGMRPNPNRKVKKFKLKEVRKGMTKFYLWVRILNKEEKARYNSNEL